ncbi:MAG: CPBP family intramembrane metalloprotease, partial [Desulfitobacterium sp.]|nr:CPBP family intramembrane metalloprotease [Desulfitobacterium sp.]
MDEKDVREESSLDKCNLEKCNREDSNLEECNREESSLEKYNLEKSNSIETENLRAVLIPSFWLTQLLLLIPGFFLLWFFFLRKGYLLGDFFFWDIKEIWLWGTLIALLGMAIQLIAWNIFPIEAFDDGGINSLLLELPVSKLFPMFLTGAFSEELLVRGVIQTSLTGRGGVLIGVLLTSVLFTLMHYRYLKKPVLFTGVFL